MKRLRHFTLVLALGAAAITAAPLAADYNELLGARAAGEAGQADRIRVGRSLGKFYGLIVETDDPAPVFERIVVHYQEGEPRVLEGTAIVTDSHGHIHIPFGAETRRIDRVELVYGAGPVGAEYRVLGVKTRPHED